MYVQPTNMDLNPGKVQGDHKLSEENTGYHFSNKTSYITSVRKRNGNKYMFTTWKLLKYYDDWHHEKDI